MPGISRSMITTSGCKLQAERDRLPSIGRLTDYIEARCSQRRPETVSVKGVIIGDQYA